MVLYYPVMAGKRKPSKSVEREKKKQKVSTVGSRNTSVHQIKRFPVSQIHQLLETKFPNGTVKDEGAVFLTGVLEYLAAELLELSVNSAKTRTSGRGLKVTLEDMLEAIETDSEFKELIDKVRRANNEDKKQ